MVPKEAKGRDTAQTAETSPAGSEDRTIVLNERQKKILQDKELPPVDRL